MKYGIVLLLFLYACSADEKDFDDMAVDICHCMTDSLVLDRNVCMGDFQKKYDQLNSYDSDEEFQEKLVNSMKKVKSCERYALLYEQSFK